MRKRLPWQGLGQQTQAAHVVLVSSGDRQANAALYRIVLCRLRWDPPTRAYAQRRTAEGMSKPEIIRCLKRNIAREIYTALLNPRPSDEVDTDKR